jgi:hypothetical protein
MKNILAGLVLVFFVGDVFADDWRMRKFDLNGDNVISLDEAEFFCTVKKSLWKQADKNSDGVLSKREARVASNYIFSKRRCG